MAQAHEKSEVEQNMAALRAIAPEVLAAMGRRVVAIKVAHDAPVPAGCKKVHFIRHGEGHHNVAQREWRTNPSWDGISEPYTPDNDPDMRYVDALLTDKGEGEARQLQEATEPHLKPQLLIVSPLRRATQTGLLAFAPHVERKQLPVIAHELCHERAGRHTCDKRLAKGELALAFPAVDYSQLQDEEDPFWGDGWTREPWKELGLRAGRFADVLFAREETHLAVAAHSAFLLAIFNAVFACDEEATRTWFGTGEMRTVLLHLEQAGANSGDQALDGKAYLEQFGVQTKLSKAIATVLRDRPNNPLLAISEILQVK